jgi:hypothetical protein
MSKNTFGSRTFSLAALIVAVASLFASMNPSQVVTPYSEGTLDPALSSSSYGTEYTMPGWNVTAIGGAGTFVDRTHGQGYLKGVVFGGDLVFWRVISSTSFAITVLGLSNFTFTDVFVFTVPRGSTLSQWAPTDMKIIDDTVFAAYGCSAYPAFNATIITSHDLVTWTQYCISSSVFVESVEQYTGPGILNGSIEYGGYRSDGGGTYAVIKAWNSTSSSEISLFRGTIYGSDDVCYMKMFNSTCMIAGDAYPCDVLYTNDGQNWTDPDLTAGDYSQYPFDWGWNIEIRNGTAYTTAEPYSISVGHGGLVKWNGTATAFDYGITVESIANGLIGGCEGLYNTRLTDFPGEASIYQYNLDGTLGPLVWKSAYSGSVSNMIYDLATAAWYGLILRRTTPQSVTFVKIAQV